MKPLLPIALTLLALGCQTKEKLVDKHRPLFRAGKALEGAIAVGVNQLSYAELLRGLSTEILVAEATGAGEAERKMVAAYREALKAYGEAAAVWKATSEDSTRYDWAKGAGILELHPELGEVLKRHAVTTATQVSPIGNRAWTAIDPAAVQQVWANAGKMEKDAATLYAALDAPAQK